MSIKNKAASLVCQLITIRIRLRPQGFASVSKMKKSVDIPAHDNMTQAAKLHGIRIGALKGFGGLPLRQIQAGCGYCRRRE